MLGAGGRKDAIWEFPFRCQTRSESGLVVDADPFRNHLLTPELFAPFVLRHQCTYIHHGKKTRSHTAEQQLLRPPYCTCCPRRSELDRVYAPQRCNRQVRARKTAALGPCTMHAHAVADTCPSTMMSAIGAACACAARAATATATVRCTSAPIFLRSTSPRFNSHACSSPSTSALTTNKQPPLPAVAMAR